MSDITVAELKARLNNGETVNMVDVREEWENDEFNVGGILLPLPQLPYRVHELEPLKHDELIMYCRSGSRSAQAKMFLEQRGFTNVRNLTGGMKAWIEAFGET